MKKGKKISDIIGIIFLCLLCPLLFAPFALCRTCREYYWDYDGYWIAEQPQITLDKGCGKGVMQIDGTRYEFDTYRSNNATYIGFYVGEHDVLWEADTKLQGDCLYLTVTVDNISNYEGQTITFYKAAESDAFDE